MKELTFSSADELLAMKFPLKRKYGPWTFKKRGMYLDYQNGRYYVDLNDCNTSAQILDWICQVNGKPWATADVIKGLIDAIDDLLEPQANLCSFGVEPGPKSPRQMLKKREEMA